MLYIILTQLIKELPCKNYKDEMAVKTICVHEGIGYDFFSAII